MKTTTLLIISGSILLFSSVTTQWVIEIVRLFKGFIDHGNEPDGPLLYFTLLSDGLDVARLSIYIVEVGICDFIMVYRLWQVWHRSWPIAMPPSCTYIASMVCGALFIYNKHKLAPNENFFTSSCAPWIAATLTCTVATNIYCSALLSYKVWSTQQAVRHATKYLRSTVASKVVAIIIESALLFTVSNVIMMITYFGQSFAIITSITFAAPLSGIAYCLIIVRFGMGGAFETNGPALSTFNLPSLHSSRPSANLGVAVKPVAINITHELETDGTDDDLAAKTSQTDALHGLGQNYAGSQV
ncbi:uncharacterized protein PHACADRAFT_203622 [Phanerochaete carnosa HHB-10118-sp]|uniref:Uncharacterized protein n=1 Tax=Phanerochaete carnosa (strain HHB-10118-sp) TaxID=650164 RepID=K5XBS3_PHACS|nr:uncharacterized protein PHACADRAFT_203622 [Phanerochaete carnosa HHB-10118-sp]EKM60417.1 hypothetical protein PHACADRAFT_203622 [Phanerochaete carnosa HHB-10118-sp]